VTLLGNDLVINENDCNLSCEYCLTGQSNLKSEHEAKLIFESPKRDRYAPGSPLHERLHAIVDAVDAGVAPPLLKVTGGEIFLVHGLMDFLREMAARYVTLVVQTNGVLVTEQQLAELRSWGNVALQVSLDSYLHHGNSYRVQSERLHERVMRSIDQILAADLATEIYCVLNDRSIEDLVPFAEWLMERGGDVVLFPFPVRGPNSSPFTFRDDQVHHVERLLEEHDRLAAVLPPRAYLVRLLDFVVNRGRRFRCHLPRMVLSSFSDGVVTPCPNIWFTDMGNVVTDDDPAAVFDKVGQTGLYRALLADHPRLDACRGCLTPWDTLSMYMDGELTLDEVCAAPAYRAAPVRAWLRDARAGYIATLDVPVEIRTTRRDGH
jgi:MoaA/NifB/PqqE/SkfB family radical SAM enzyme